MKLQGRWVLACLVPLSLAAACSPPGEGVRGDRLAQDRGEALARLHSDDPTFAVRLNPAPCDCPNFEVLLGDAWHRVFLEPADLDGPVPALRAALELANQRGEIPGSATVSGKLSGSLKRAPNGLYCVQLKVLAVCGPAGCPAKK